MNKMYFISGASGVGKTAIIPYLKQNLSYQFEIHDFDERGVPAGADHAWRLNETRYWIQFSQEKAIQNKTVVVCGFSNPDEIEELKKDFKNIEVISVLLDGQASVIEQRLRNRNNNPVVKENLERVVGSAEDFIKKNTNFIPVIREIFMKYNLPIIDTSNLEPQAVAEKVVEILKMSI